MLSIYMVANLEKPEASSIAARIAAWFEEKGGGVLLSPDLARRIGRADLEGPKDIPKHLVDAIVVLGGDGTILNAARRFSHLRRPFLGVNLGRLGFLTELEVRDLPGALDDIAAGRYSIDERMMLQASVVREDRELEVLNALNDVVITKGTFARMIHLKTHIDDVYVDTYPADGLIVATPTGSTAYSLSAGGPIVDPNMGLYIMTPICPHSLYARSMVFPAIKTLSVEIISDHGDTSVTVDGQEGYRLLPGDRVVIRRRDTGVSFIRRPGWSFYGVLREKMKQG